MLLSLVFSFLHFLIPHTFRNLLAKGLCIWNDSCIGLDSWPLILHNLTKHKVNINKMSVCILWIILLKNIHPHQGVNYLSKHVIELIKSHCEYLMNFPREDPFNPNLHEKYCYFIETVFENVHSLYIDIQ